MDPTNTYPDTTVADPWPVVRLAPGLYQCASFSRRHVAYLVDLRGRKPVCAHPHWQPGTVCKHIAEVQRQAPALDAARISEAPAPERVAGAWNSGAGAKSPGAVAATQAKAYSDLYTQG